LFDFSQIDNSWTLFLDRDGVINVEKRGTYVLHVSGFVFYDGVQLALQKLAKIFGVIVITTNQRGVSKGSMSLENLHDIHAYMLEEVAKEKGRINKVYYCADLNDESPNRKPNTGMALQAQKDFPQIDFSKSIMVGNSISDMQFARNTGMYSVFIASTDPETEFPHKLIDARFGSLLDFANAIPPLRKD
jgi:D-glycero-D-manno-heptose 1,7-bisphosphate phosphatase